MSRPKANLPEILGAAKEQETDRLQPSDFGSSLDLL
jgi:hypothetical protein